MQTIKIRNLDSTEDNTVTDNSYLALSLNENDVKRESEDPNDFNPRITVKTTISQLRKAILPTIGSSPPVSENEEGGIDVGIGDVILDENGQPLATQPPVVIKQGGKEQIKVTDDGISLKENVVIDKSLSVTQGITTLGGINAQGTSLLSGITTFTGLTNFGGPTTFTNPVTFNEVASDPAPTDGKIYRKSDGLYFNGSKILTEGQGGKWVDGNSSGDIVYNGGNVGIGTASPDAKLAVETDAGTYSLSTNDFSQVGLLIKSNTTEGSGNKGGSVAFTALTGAGGKHAAITAVQTDVDSNNVGLAFEVHQGGTSGDPLIEAMRIDRNGKVGIGTTSPSAKLEIETDSYGVLNAGSGANLILETKGVARTADIGPFINFRVPKTSSTSEDMANIGAVCSDSTANSRKADLVFWTRGGSLSTFTEKMRIDSDGKVGIGTDSPDVKLEIKEENPTIRLKDEASVSNYSDIRTNDGVLLLQADEGNNVANSKIQFDIDGSDKMTIESDGAIKLNNTASAPTTTTNKLYSVSSVLYWGGNKILTGAAASAGSGSGSGGVTIGDISGLQTELDKKLDKPAANSEPTFVDSDINLKTNISPIQSPIKFLENIRGVNFEWKKESNKSGEDQGLIAQEVEKVIPSAVKKGEDGYFKVDYTKLVPFLLEAVKDLSKRVKELEKN
jgi:hypothetical protein